jgi:hypothetical protein
MAPFDACGHSAGYTVIVQHRTPRAVRGGAKSITDSGAGLGRQSGSAVVGPMFVIAS